MKILAKSIVFAFTLLTAGCAAMGGAQPIMREAPGDPAGSANNGTGSVTTNAMIPPEAWSAGIGLGP
jgi:hypothetical protein